MKYELPREKIGIGEWKGPKVIIELLQKSDLESEIMAMIQETHQAISKMYKLGFVAWREANHPEKYQEIMETGSCA